MLDKDGHLSTGGAITLAAMLMGPVILGIALIKLFFRAPLAAMLGGAFCTAVIALAIFIVVTMTWDINPLGFIALVVFGFFALSWACYGLATSDQLTRFFIWECHILKFALMRGGLLGRAFYIFAQVVPGLIVATLVIGMLLGQVSSPSSQADTVSMLVFLGWLVISQIVVLRFHRTEHPVGQWVTFTGRPREMANYVDETEAA